MINIVKNKTLIGVTLLGLFGVSSCKNHQALQYSPPVKASEWCVFQPCLQLGDLTISQPTSSLLVFILTLFTFYVAYHFYNTRQNQKSRYWWFVSLFLGGLGALFAGISFQMFGFTIKCEGKEYCHLTSWWEIAYNILTVWASAALLMAIAYSFLNKNKQRLSKYYGLVLSIIYPVICIYGAVIPNQFLLSFECMILFTVPTYLFIIVFFVVLYFKNKNTIVKKYLSTWILLVLTSILYVFYQSKGYTQILWEQEIWFSENDVLHGMMMIWLLYILIYLSPHVQDKEAP